MASEIIGEVIKILELQSGEGKKGTWYKQNFVVKTKEQYAKEICFDFFGDAGLLEKIKYLKIGSEIKVFFNAESREFNNKWYTNLNVWKFDVISGDITQKNEVKKEAATKKEVVKVEEANDFPDVNGQGAEDDLPF